MKKKIENNQGLLFPRISDDEQDKAEQQIIEQQKIIDYEIREYTIELLINKFKDGEENDTNEIFLPKYQRKFVWAEKNQCEFIESLFLGLPIPYMFTADKDGRSEIVDGSQRIRTLRYFLDNELQLTGLTKLDTLNNFRFKDLPISRQLRFKKKTIRLIELTDKADNNVRKDMFSRINRSQVKLSDMEIRRGEFAGKFMDFIDKCAENARFHLLCPMTIERSVREDRAEMVLRFFAYGDCYEKFVHIVKDFLDDYAKEKNKNGFDEEEMDNQFENMLDFVEKYFPNGFKKGDNFKSVARVRFEAISVGTYLALKVRPDLKNPNMEWLNSEEFEDQVTTDAANNRNKLIGRLEFVRDKLLGKK
jgi:hypothetical protein